MQLNDDFLYDALRGTSLEKRDKALEYLYNQIILRKKTIVITIQNGGTERDGEDVFIDSLILLEQRIKSGDFKRQSTISTYLLGICKNRWRDISRTKSKVNLVSDNTDFEIFKKNNPQDSIDVKLIYDERNDLLDQLLSETGERCKQVLLKQSKNFSYSEIAVTMNITKETVKQAIKNCRKKLRSLILKKDLLQQLKI